MKLVAIFAVLAVTILSSEAIFNGVNIQSAPFFARIDFIAVQGGPTNFGGGSIISQRHVLTAESVMAGNIWQVIVFVGGTTRATQRPMAVGRRIHRADFVANTRLNDIGILELVQTLTFDGFVQPIALPLLGQELPLENVQGVVYGIGGFPGQNPQQQNLQAAFMRVNSQVRCSTRNPAPNAQLQFCGEDERNRTDFCIHDVGGPMVVTSRGQHILVGIASIQVCQLNINQNPSQPSLFTRISAYRQWIQQQIQI